jgi:hypothetical protein
MVQMSLVKDSSASVDTSLFLSSTIQMSSVLVSPHYKKGLVSPVKASSSCTEILAVQFPVREIAYPL